MSKTVEIDTTYPALSEVRELFDLTILLDITEAPEGHAPGCASGLSAPGVYVACTCGRVLPTVQIYALGVHSELGAGIRGGPSTPWFTSLELLEDFCKRHLKGIREIAAKQDESGDYTWVDMTEWT